MKCFGLPSHRKWMKTGTSKTGKTCSHLHPENNAIAYAVVRKKRSTIHTRDQWSSKQDGKINFELLYRN